MVGSLLYHELIVLRGDIILPSGGGQPGGG